MTGWIGVRIMWLSGVSGLESTAWHNIPVSNHSKVGISSHCHKWIPSRIEPLHWWILDVKLNNTIQFVPGFLLYHVTHSSTLVSSCGYVNLCNTPCT